MAIVHEIVIQTPQQRELAALENIIEETQAAAEMNLESWKTIRTQKLYKANGFTTWKTYCKKRWNRDSDSIDRKIQLHEIVRDTVPSAIGDPDLADRHKAELASFPPDMREEIYDTAKQTAPGGKLTSAWIEQTGRRLMDARMVAIKEQQKKGPTTEAAEDDEDEAQEEDEETEEDPEAEEEPEEMAPEHANEPASHEAAPGAKPSPQAKGKKNPPSLEDQAIRDAEVHPITQAEQIQKWEEQAKRWVHKGERLALSLNCTPQDLLERFGS